MAKSEYVETTVIHVRLDMRVKEEAQYIVDEIGLTLSGVINAFLKQLIRTREVSFAARNKMTPYFEKIMAESRNDRNRYRFDPMPLEDTLEN